MWLAQSYSESSDIHAELLHNFPKLRNGGGYELLRLPEGGGKLLQVIAYNYLCGMNPANLIADVNEVPESSLVHFLKQVD